MIGRCEGGRVEGEEGSIGGMREEWALVTPCMQNPSVTLQTH